MPFAILIDSSADDGECPGGVWQVDDTQVSDLSMQDVQEWLQRPSESWQER
jgi:hypothetical protein